MVVLICLEEIIEEGDEWKNKSPENKMFIQWGTTKQITNEYCKLVRYMEDNLKFYKTKPIILVSDEETQ